MHIAQHNQPKAKVQSILQEKTYVKRNKAW